MVREYSFYYFCPFKFIKVYFCHSILPPLGNAPRGFEKAVYSTVIGKSVLQISIRSNWVIMFKSLNSLWNFCLVVLSTIESRVLNSPNIIAEFSIFPLICQFCCLDFDSVLSNVYIFLIVLSPRGMDTNYFKICVTDSFCCAVETNITL